MKYNKNRKNKGRAISFSTQVPRDYQWKVLGAFVQDLKGYLSEADLSLLNHIIRNRDFKAYLSLGDTWGLHSIYPCDPLFDFQSMKAKYGISSLLKKYLAQPDAELDQVALKKLLDAESHCKAFNESLVDSLLAGEDEFTVDILTYARSFLKKLLGESVPLRDVIRDSRHGPGANLDTCNGNDTVFDKFSNIPYSCTKGAVSYATYMICSDERWFRTLKHLYWQRNSLPVNSPINMSEFWDQNLSIVNHNRITFVAKDAKTSRSIAIEPALNIMLQLGVDGVIRKRLKRWGIDLDDQNVNRLLSRKGSMDGSVCTIDLSAASDLISLEICRALLPDSWFSFLVKLRSPTGELSDNTSITYEKMSSMGNGFTFALESAVFAAIIYAVYKHNNEQIFFSKNASVFGDDLIVKTDLYTDVCYALNICGFKINTEKSFSKGPIRESCGADWFKGLPIRPILLKEPPKTVQDLYTDHNRIKRYLDLRFGIEDSNTAKTIRKWIPKELNLTGPYSDEVFDSWLHDDQELLWSNGFYRFRRLIKTAKLRKYKPAELYGSRFLFMQTHNLLQAEPVPLFIRKKVKAPDGKRFSVLAKGFTVKRKPTLCSIWHKVYYEHLPAMET